MGAPHLPQWNQSTTTGSRSRVNLKRSIQPAKTSKPAPPRQRHKQTQRYPPIYLDHKKQRKCLVLLIFNCMLAQASNDHLSQLIGSFSLGGMTSNDQEILRYVNR